jgi:hypothetical protein
MAVRSTLVFQELKIALKEDESDDDDIEEVEEDGEESRRRCFYKTSTKRALYDDNGIGIRFRFKVWRLFSTCWAAEMYLKSLS